MRYIDSHCHFNSPELRDHIPEALQRCREAGVELMAVVGSTMDDSREALELCRRYGDRGLFPVVGVHPHEVKDLPDDVPDELIAMASRPEVRAWGEIGLDYYYDLSPREKQIDMLAKQLEAAKALKKPVVFHMRDAYDDFWPLMTADRVPEKAELHCFTGSMDDMRKALDLGWKFGVTGMCTFRKAENIRDLLRAMPLDAILCETDSPWMSPVPFRGRVCEPFRAPLIYQKAAEVKGVDPEVFAEQVWRNNVEFFDLEESKCLNTD